MYVFEGSALSAVEVPFGGWGKRKKILGKVSSHTLLSRSHLLSRLLVCHRKTDSEC